MRLGLTLYCKVKGEGAHEPKAQTSETYPGFVFASPPGRDDRRDLGNSRPISILPTISKVFEKEFFNPLYRYLKDNSILFEFQSGFHPLHSTVSGQL